MGAVPVELSPLAHQHVPALTAITVTEWTRIGRFLGRAVVEPPELRQALLGLARAAHAPGDRLPWHGVVLVDGHPAGSVILGAATARPHREGFWRDVLGDEDATTVDVTVWVAQEWCGLGVGRTAVRQALDHARDAFGSRRALAAIQPGNAASLALFRALGFRQVRSGSTWLVFERVLAGSPGPADTGRQAATALPATRG